MFIVVVDAPLGDGHGGVREHVQPATTLLVAPTPALIPSPLAMVIGGYCPPQSHQTHTLWLLECDLCAHFTDG